MENVMMAYVSVALGGALGALARYVIAQLAPPVKSGFPFATLTVNVLGSLLIGVLYMLIVERATMSSHWREVLMIGFCGGFTTFSAFSLDTLNLWNSGQAALAVLYVVLSVIFCIVAAFIGISLTRLV